MDTGVTLEATQDMEAVRQIMVLPEIWEVAGEDGINPDEFMPANNDLAQWFLVRDGEDVIGVLLLHHDNTTTLRFHPYLLVAHRNKGRAMMRELYKLVLKLPQEINKLVAAIPEHNRKLVNFAQRVGMRKEGFSPGSFRKNGELYGQFYIGMTREQIEDFLDG